MNYLICFTHKDYGIKRWFVFIGAKNHTDFLNDTYWEFFNRGNDYTWSACQLPDNYFPEFAFKHVIDYKRWRNW